MKKVEFEQIKSELWGIGLIKGGHYAFRGVEEIIQKRLQDGWEYCGWVPIEARATGDVEIMSLVFQKYE